MVKKKIGSLVYAEGDKLWAEAILETYGNIKVEWKDDNCILETGEAFGVGES